MDDWRLTERFDRCQDLSTGLFFLAIFAAMAASMLWVAFDLFSSTGCRYLGVRSQAYVCSKKEINDQAGMALLVGLLFLWMTLSFIVGLCKDLAKPLAKRPMSPALSFLLRHPSLRITSGSYPVSDCGRLSFEVLSLDTAGAPRMRFRIGLSEPSHMKYIPSDQGRREFTVSPGDRLSFRWLDDLAGLEYSRAGFSSSSGFHGAIELEARIEELTTLPLAPDSGRGTEGE